MKRSIKTHLQKCDQVDLLSLILSFVPDVVQSALNEATWCLADLMYNTSSYMTSRKGIYFGAATDTNAAFPVAGYVGTSLGMNGIMGRVKNHTSQKYRLRDLASNRPKLLYKYVEGWIDTRRTLSFISLAYFQFTGLTSDFESQVLSDIVELMFMVLLDVLEIGDTDNWYQTKVYADLRPNTFRCRDQILPTNRISPCQAFAITRKANVIPEVIDQSCYTHQKIVAVKFGDVLDRPWKTAYFFFSDILRIPVALKVLQRFRVQEDQMVTVRFDLWEGGVPHPNRWIQEQVDDPESKEAYSLGIEVSGSYGEAQTPFSFWLRRNTDGEDWSSERLTSNHSGIAVAMSIIESLQDQRRLPVPRNRVKVCGNDPVKAEYHPCDDLTGTSDYEARATYRARDYTSVTNGTMVHMDKTFEEELGRLCVCDLPQYDCMAAEHDPEFMPSVSAGKKPSNGKALPLYAVVEYFLPVPCRYREKLKCFVTFHNPQVMACHARKEHPAEQIERLNAEASLRVLQCTWAGLPKCTEMFKTTTAMSRHIRRKHKGETQQHIRIDTVDDSSDDVQDSLGVNEVDQRVGADDEEDDDLKTPIAASLQADLADKEDQALKAAIAASISDTRSNNTGESSSTRVSTAPRSFDSKSTTMSQRWVDDGGVPPYSWRCIIGMILLDKSKAGDMSGMSLREIQQEITRRWTHYVLSPGVMKYGWPTSVRDVIKRGKETFVKRGNENDRSFEKKKGNDKWILRPSVEDEFITPKRNLTKLTAFGGKAPGKRLSDQGSAKNEESASKKSKKK